MNEEKVLTTNQGVMINDNQNSLTVGEHGPVLLQDVQFIEKSEGGPNAPFNSRTTPGGILRRTHHPSSHISQY